MGKKLFAPSEWDDDVPDVDFGENLKKVGKSKKFKKNESNVTENDINGGTKRKISTVETPAKKKKRTESDSYIKFESPNVDSILNPLDISINDVSHDDQSQKKKKKKNKSKLLVSVDKTEILNEEPQTKISEKSVKKNKKLKLKDCTKNLKLKNPIENSTVEDKPLVNGANKISKNKRKKDRKKEEKNKQDVKEVSQPNVISTGSSSAENNEKAPINKKKSNLYLKKIKNLLENVTVPTNDNEDNNEKPTPESETNAILQEMNEVIEKKSPPKQKSLRERMMERLKGARFRYLNEQMYRHNSNDAIRIFKQDPGAFKAYHEGYQQQVNKWPLNPLDVIINDIKKLPKTHIIADLGCGDGRLAKSVPHKVYSFDLVALDSTINVCDMAHTPLQTGQVDCVVFCLSLMGTNSKDYIMEANRILKTGGLLKIAEVESRFENVDQFTGDLKKYGFSLVKKDYNHQIFYFMDFKKENDVKKRNKVPEITLNPCIYKKR